MKNILIAGGLCGTTMLMAAEKLQKRCDAENIPATVKIHNLWEGAAITGKGYDIIIEMFPYFKDMQCPVLSGKPFIAHVGEKQLITEIIHLLKEE